MNIPLKSLKRAIDALSSKVTVDISDILDSRVLSENFINCTKEERQKDIEALKELSEINMNKEYNHKSNAGNYADLWKHKILLKLAELLKPKSYFETHCGYPTYNITNTTQEVGKIVLSSWMKIRLNNECRVFICDINEDINRYVPSGMDISFISANGWAVLENTKDKDLCFIDPPYTSLFDFVLLQAVLDDKNFTKPIVAWYPMIKDLNPANYDFGHTKIETKFEEGKLVGCGMVFRNIDQSIIDQLEAE